MNNARTFITVLQDIENVIEAAIIEWIIKRRGVEFIYWLAPKQWEDYINEQ